MKKIYGVVVVVAFCVALIQLGGCGGDPEPDPCLGKKITGGSFSMGEIITNYGGVDTLLLSDTVITDNFVVFRADSNYLSYDWKIGDDPRTFTTNEVSLFFREPISNLPIRLIAKWIPNKKCFPEDDGIDTVYKYLSVIDKKENPIFGKYEGANKSNPNDIFRIEITHDIYFDKINILNINKGCYPIDESIGLRGFITRMGYKKLHFNADFYYESCKDPQGWFSLDNSGMNAEVKYSIGNGSPTQTATKRIKEIFNGKKIY